MSLNFETKAPKRTHQIEFHVTAHKLHVLIPRHTSQIVHKS